MPPLTPFRDALRQKEFVITGGLELEPGSTRADIEASAGALGPWVDALQVADSRSLAAHMSPLAAAGIVLDCDVDCIVNLSARDRNALALEGELLGAAVLGITSLILIRGEKFPHRAGIKTRGIFEMGATGLIEAAARIGADGSLVSPPGFCLGTAITVFSPAPDWQPTRLIAKLEAGARFLQTHPCLNSDLVATYLARLIEQRVTHRASVIIEVPVLTSLEEARALKSRFPAAPLPDALLRRIELSTDPAAEGAAVAAEVIGELRDTPGVSGVHVVARDPAHAIMAVRAATG